MIRNIAIVFICCIGTFGIFFNLITRISSDSSKLPNEIQASLSNGGISLAPKDKFIERFVTSNFNKFFIGYTFYNLLFSAEESAAGTRSHYVGVNSIYRENGINIYFIDPKEDKMGILDRYVVNNARSFPEVGVVLINTNFIKQLLSMRPFVENLTGQDLPDIGIQNGEHIGDQVYLKLEKPVEGVTPWQPNELYEAQALFVAMYVALHEVGHIHDYDSNPTAYYTTSSQTRESNADNYFVELFANLALVKEFKDSFPTARFVGTSGMITFASYQLLKDFKETQADLYNSKKRYILKNSIWSSHPPLSYRLINVLYLFCKKSNILTGKNYSDASEYKKILDKITLKWTVLP